MVMIDDNSCAEGSVLGGILGGAGAGAASRGDGRWWAIPSWYRWRCDDRMSNGWVVKLKSTFDSQKGGKNSPPIFWSLRFFGNCRSNMMRNKLLFR